jgi:hypothetical protein
MSCWLYCVLTSEDSLPYKKRLLVLFLCCYLLFSFCFASSHQWSLSAAKPTATGMLAGHQIRSALCCLKSFTFRTLSCHRNNHHYYPSEPPKHGTHSRSSRK